MAGEESSHSEDLATGEDLNDIKQTNNNKNKHTTCGLCLHEIGKAQVRVTDILSYQ